MHVHTCRDCSGTIDAAELAQALKRYGIYGANVEDLLKSADVNGDGQVRGGGPVPVCGRMAVRG